MPKRWRIHPHDSDRIESFSQAARVPHVLAQLLICRGISEAEQARSFLDVKLSQLRPPESLPGAKAAAEHLASAIRDRKRIVVYGDYDVDGITGASLLWRCLRLLGADAGYYVPHRLEEGYGLNRDALTKLHQQGAQVVVTVDCGIASVAEAQHARSLGLELIITDHHTMGASLPDATVLVHPQLPNGNYPFHGLCGAGVAFKVAWALCQQAEGSTRVSERMRNFLLFAVGLAALGTVADVVPLVDENRVLVHCGLLALCNQASVGVKAMLKAANLSEKPALSCEDIAFTLAPRLNSVGRLGQAELGIELLTTDSEERATALAEYLNELNANRQSLERSIYLAANKQATEQHDPEGDAALVLADRGWHPGVIGIVAGRLAEKFHRPVAVISLDTLGVKPGVGSARSVPGFDLHMALSACSELLVSYGGHAAAAGLKIEEAQIDAFRDAFCEYAETEIAREQRVAELWIDAEAPLASLSLDVIKMLERMAPFGAANARPVLCATGVQLMEPPKRIGSGERHLSLRISQAGLAMRCVAFGGGDWFDSLSACGDQELDIAFRPVINEFRGRRTVELHLLDWRHAEAPSAISR